MSSFPTLRSLALAFPAAGAWRLHPAPTMLGLRQSEDPARDRFDDPDREYRVRYFATSVRGAMLEVLDHFRPNESAETALNQVDGLLGVDILEQESAGLVTGNWLSKQRLAHALLPPTARFVDVTNPDALAELNGREPIQNALHVELALHGELAEQCLGPNARLDGATIRMTGPLARVITQAVSREIYDDDARYAGLSYFTRFDGNERCWAVFDDRVQVEFDKEDALDNLNSDHLHALDGVARTYRLHLPAEWRLNGS